jgi:hypothetical protein
MHGVDHRPGGPDPIVGLELGGGALEWSDVGGAGGIPAYTAYTPQVRCSVTNPVGYTRLGRWLRLGNMVHAQISINYSFGGGVVKGVGQYFVEIPFKVQGTIGIPGWAYISSGGSIPSHVQPLTVTFNNTPIPPPYFVSFTYPATWPGGNQTELTDVLPFVWGDPTTLTLNLLYETAP